MMMMMPTCQQTGPEVQSLCIQRNVRNATYASDATDKAQEYRSGVYCCVACVRCFGWKLLYRLRVIRLSRLSSRHAVPRVTRLAP